MAKFTEETCLDLPSDIIIDVLSRLPVKALIRLKSVCKTWYAIIENPNFVETQVNMQPRIELNPSFMSMLVTTDGPGITKKCMFLHYSEACGRPIFSELPYMGFCKVVGICDGLLCASLSLDSAKLIICNPTTGQSRLIPPAKIPIREHEFIFLGFGLQDNVGYVLIRIICRVNFTVAGAELYTMCSDSWREIYVKLGKSRKTKSYRHDYSCEHSYLEAVVINGVFHWKFQGLYYGTLFASFNLRTNVFHVIDAPWAMSNSIYSQLHAINEKLALIVTPNYDYYFTKSFDLWVLNENMSYTEEDKIKFSVIPSYSEKREDETIVLASTSNAELILGKSYGESLKLFLYDLNCQEIKYLHDVDFAGSIDTAYLYTECLTPVK